LGKKTQANNDGCNTQESHGSLGGREMEAAAAAVAVVVETE